MLKNYIKVAIRNLLRFKTYSVINIAGLAIGIACCLLILLYINDEISYDNFHVNADRIYRVNTDLKFGGTELAMPLCSDMLGPTMKKDYPAIEEYVRLNSWGNKQVKLGNTYNNENHITFADSTFFKVFTFPAIAGNTAKALNEPHSVVITKSIANKYFGTINAVGKLIETNDNGSTLYKVTAVIDDMPENSHFRFEFIFPMMDFQYSNWNNYIAINFTTYFLLRKGADPTLFANYFEEYHAKYVYPFVKDFLNISSKEAFEKAGNRFNHTVTPLRDIHLYSKLEGEFRPSGTIEYVYIFSAIAIFILIIACVNFMNLTTARSANRAREVGIRKVLGTEQKNIISQFLFESSLMSLLSVVLAVLLVIVALPSFNSLAGKDIHAQAMLSAVFIFALLLLPILIGLVAGSYPAFFLSRFMPAQIIKGELSAGTKSGKLRSALVVFQFATSIILIVGTIVIYNQLNYIQNKNLGYQKEHLLVLNDAYSLNDIDAYKNEMLNYPGVSSATISGYLPIPSNRNFTTFFSERTAPNNGLTMQVWNVDYDYLQTFGIQINQGRNFNKEFGTDSTGIILNETGVKQLGLSEPIGKSVYTQDQKGNPIEFHVIGVVKDFNYESLRQNIGSLGLLLRKNYGNITFKLNTTNISGIIEKMETLWKSLAPGKSFSYKFVDDSFNEVYKTEKRVGSIALTFSILAVLIACLGLFGLAAFMAEQKTKEIGIRKVLGASITSLLFMLSKEFFKWVLFANIIAWPIAYYFMDKWLQDYVYRTNIGWWMFVLSGGIALVIAIVIVSFQSIKAATANPVESLKYE